MPVITLLTHSQIINTNYGQVICVTNKFNKIVCFTNEPTIPYNPLTSFGFTYSGVTDNIVFLVYSSTNLSSWHYLGKITNDWFSVDSSKGNSFLQEFVQATQLQWLI